MSFLCYGSDCGEPSDELTNDPTLDLWCGDKLCESWDTTGSVTRVGTWHAADFGVSLASRGSSLSQTITRNSEELLCVRINLLGDWDDASKLTLEFDFGNDGVVDWTQKLPPRHWQGWSSTIYAENWFSEFRMTVRRDGVQGAQLAEIRARKDLETCTRDTEESDRGQPCSDDFDCSHVCHAAATSTAVLNNDAGVPGPVCSDCRDDSECDTGWQCAPELAGGFSCLPR
jgi:hypothetical protein